MYPGILIAVEGIDGAGKTTQVDLIGRALAEAGEVVVCSKEPTDGPWGRKIRQSAQNGRMSLDDELHAFIEDRREHVANKIRPALERGEIVILDRYYHSTVAYQGSRGADLGTVLAQMREMAPQPDLVVLIDADPTIALGRIAGSRGEVPNQFERLDSLKSVREVFLGLAAKDATIQKIDGHQSIQAVYGEIAKLLLDTVLKQKRCAKAYGCDVFYCSERAVGNCRWAKDRAVLGASG